MSEFVNGFLWGVGMVVVIFLIFFLRGEIRMGVTP